MTRWLLALVVPVALTACDPGQVGETCLEDAHCSAGLTCDVPADNDGEGACVGVAPEDVDAAGAQRSIATGWEARATDTNG